MTEVLVWLIPALIAACCVWGAAFAFRQDDSDKD